MMPLTQMNTHLMCPKYFPNVFGVPFLSMFNLPFSKAAGNTKLTTQKQCNINNMNIYFCVCIVSCACKLNLNRKIHDIIKQLLTKYVSLCGNKIQLDKTR